MSINFPTLMSCALMSYPLKIMFSRHDSDFVSPYGYVTRLKRSLHDAYTFRKQIEKLVKGKKKLAAWFVSHCPVPNRRDDLVKELQKYMPIDIFGTCGSLKCGDRRKRNEPACNDLLYADYKFYFALENSICEWVTFGPTILNTRF